MTFLSALLYDILSPSPLLWCITISLSNVQIVTVQT